MSEGSRLAVTVFEAPQPVPPEGGDWISRREAAYLAGLFSENGVAELLAYAFTARIDVERITASRSLH